MARGTLLGSMGRMVGGATSRQLRRTRERRGARLDAVGAPQAVLEELTALVDATARRLSVPSMTELEELLDAYVDVAVALRWNVRQLLRAPLLESTSTPSSDRTKRRRSIWRRRAAARIKTYHALLGDIAELIRLYAERAAIPDVDHLLEDDLVSRVLAAAHPGPGG